MNNNNNFNNMNNMNDVGDMNFNLNNNNNQNMINNLNNGFNFNNNFKCNGLIKFNNNFNNKSNNYNFNNNFFMISFMQNQLFQKRFQVIMQNMMNYLMVQNYFKKMKEIKEQNEIKKMRDKINRDLLDVMKEPYIFNDDFDLFNNLTGGTLSFDINTLIFTAFMNLDPDLLSGHGDNLEGKWAKNEKRGGKKYIPPKGWIGFGLNVLNKYDDGNNDWLACNGREGEWCVAYHGACRNLESDEVKKTVQLILKENLKPGTGQSFQDYDDLYHPNQKVGTGVYNSLLPARQHRLGQQPSHGKECRHSR
jgi:hypothetical protein